MARLFRIAWLIVLALGCKRQAASYHGGHVSPTKVEQDPGGALVGEEPVGLCVTSCDGAVLREAITLESQCSESGVSPLVCEEGGPLVYQFQPDPVGEPVGKCIFMCGDQSIGVSLRTSEPDCAQRAATLGPLRMAGGSQVCQNTSLRFEPDESSYELGGACTYRCLDGKCVKECSTR